MICKECKKKDKFNKNLQDQILSLTSELGNNLPSSPGDIPFPEFVRLVQDYIRSIEKIIEN